MQEFPYLNTKIPVQHSAKELSTFVEGFPGFKFCIYLAHKDEEGWERSTSRAYMNRLFPRFLYVPVDILKEDVDELRAVYSLVTVSPEIVAINQTQPHKSNAVMQEFLEEGDIPANVDAIVKDEGGMLVAYDLNGPSFIRWFKDEAGGFESATVLLVGVGGVGEPIARALAYEHTACVYLIDPVSKVELQAELSELMDVEYYTLQHDLDLPETVERLVLINCAGKEGVEGQSKVEEWLTRYKEKGFIFVDLRPHLDIDIVKKAESLGWKAFTGHGMNAYNDHVLVSKIAELIGGTSPKFEEFRKAVAGVS
ncbi:MAG: hypothetical protein WCO52_01695 [bacterium]